MTPMLAQIDGLWWPADDTDAREVILRDCQPSIAQLLTHFTGRDLIVQAGANVGVYPIALADHFRTVITCEPDPANFACLEKNLAARDSLARVGAFSAAFGEAPGKCMPIEVEPRNCGAHRVSFTDKGAIAVTTIDLALTMAAAEACDCIWLDIEGSELLALKGAEQAIERFSPVIAVEDKGLQEAFGIRPGALQEWLGERGYQEADRIGRDKIYTRTA